MTNEKEILLRLSFVINNAAQANKAVEQLKNLGAFQDILTQKSVRFNEQGKQTIHTIRATGRATQQEFGKMSQSIDNTIGRIGRWKATSHGSYTAATVALRSYNYELTRSQRAQIALVRSSEYLRRVSWSFTMASMSMLGVFFSMVSFTMLLQRGFNMLAAPMMDIENAATQVAEAFAFGTITGEDMTSLFGDMGGIIQDNVAAWQNLEMLQGKIFLSLNQVGTALFTNKEFVDSLSTAIDSIAVALSDPVLVEAIASLALSMADAVPEFVKLVPHIARLMEVMAPFVPMMMATATAAAILMPILANISAAIFILSKVFGAASAVMAFFFGTSTGAAAYVGVMSTLSAVASVVGSAIAGISLATLGWIAAIAAVVALIGYLLYRFGILQAMIQKIRELFVWATSSVDNFARALVALSGPAGFAAVAVEQIGGRVLGTASAQPIGGSVDRSTTYITQENYLQIYETADADAVTDRMSNNIANRRNR